MIVVTPAQPTPTTPVTVSFRAPAAVGDGAGWYALTVLSPSRRSDCEHHEEAEVTVARKGARVRVTLRPVDKGRWCVGDYTGTLDLDRRVRCDDRIDDGACYDGAAARSPALHGDRAVRSGLTALLVLAGCGAAPAQPAPAGPDPRLVIRIADLTDCGGSGTTCPELTNERRVRVGLDGRLEPFRDVPLRRAPGPGPRPFGVRLQPGHVQVRGAGAPLEIALRGFGRRPRLGWSPSGRRFSVLEDFDNTRSDRVLIVDPARRRWWRLPVVDRVRELLALAWTDDDALVAEIVGRDGYLRLVALDPVSGKVRRSRTLNDVFREIAWSPTARRLAIEDSESRVGVLAVTHPTDITWTDLKGVPTWSPDGTRILVTGDGEYDGGLPIPIASDGIDTRNPTAGEVAGGRDHHASAPACRRHLAPGRPHPDRPARRGEQVRRRARPARPDRRRRPDRTRHPRPLAAADRPRRSLQPRAARRPDPHRRA